LRWFNALNQAINQLYTMPKSLVPTTTATATFAGHGLTHSPLKATVVVTSYELLLLLLPVTSCCCCCCYSSAFLDLGNQSVNTARQNMRQELETSARQCDR